MLAGLARMGISATVATLGIYTIGFLRFRFRAVFDDRSLLWAFTAPVAFALVILTCSMVGVLHISRTKNLVVPGNAALLALAVVLNAHALGGGTATMGLLRLYPEQACRNWMELMTVLALGQSQISGERRSTFSMRACVRKAHGPVGAANRSWVESSPSRVADLEALWNRRYCGHRARGVL